MVWSEVELHHELNEKVRFVGTSSGGGLHLVLGEEVMPVWKDENGEEDLVGCQDVFLPMAGWWW